MGNTRLARANSLEKFFPNFHREDWQEVGSSVESSGLFGEFTTLRNRTTKEEIDRYELNFSSDREQRIYEECFIQRLRQEYLVNAFHYQSIKGSGMCSTAKGAVVYIQHIPIRLSDVTDIPFDESLYILRSSLLGFEKLYNESGYFQVMEEQVCIDKEGHIKVWLNADLSKNYPDSYDDETHLSRDYEKIMVTEIVAMIEKNTNFEGGDRTEDSRYGFLPLSVFMDRNNTRHASFPEIQEVIRQYVARYDVRVPKKCFSVIEIFQAQYGDDFDVTSTSDFLEHLDVGGNQDAYDHRTNEKEQTINIMSSRTKNDFKNNQIIVKPGPRLLENQNESHLDAGEASYKEYQPISIYKPNMRNSRASASAASSNRGRISENLKLRSHKSSVEASHKNSNRGSGRERFVAITNRSNRIERKSFQDEGLYGNRSDHSQHFYNQIGNDLDRIYGDDLKMNLNENERLRSSNASSRSNQMGQNYAPQLRISNASSSLSSNQERMKVINSSRSSYENHQRQQPRISQASQSNMSSRQGRVNLPKITFSYEASNQEGVRVGQREPKEKQQERQQERQQEEASYDAGVARQIDIELERKIEEEFMKDVEEQLRKEEARERQEALAFRKKMDSFPEKISECEPEEEVDPEIMKDLLQEFPEEREVVY